MTKWKRAIPNGTHDILFEQCSLKVDIEQTLRGVFRSRGYKEIRTPTMEFYDVFSFNGIDEEKMFKFFDHRGRIVVLRPDMTIPIARVIGTTTTTLPLKVTYSGNVYRVNTSLKGKQNEVTQTGIEIIGVRSLRAEVECVISAIRALQAVGINDFKIEIGHAKLYKLLKTYVEMTEEEEKTLRTCIGNKSYSSLRQFFQNISSHAYMEEIELLKSLPRLFGSIDVINRAKEMTANVAIHEALEEIRIIYDIVEQLGYGEYVAVDLGMVQNIHYYTGVIFRGYAEQIGEEIVSGGRYDTLMEQFGSSQPAIGLALQVNQLVRMKYGSNEALRPSEEVLIHYQLSDMERAEIVAETYRTKGVVAELSPYELLDETKRYAREHRIHTIIHIEEDVHVYEWNSEWVQKEGDDSGTNTNSIDEREIVG
ncbi:ATP phosphoribosyltransferase regulatory subunit [Priestia taiwanensis]|uniref:ATP phosphoribosyltransferase regulatory subunit n=1 Tax=Priestia taiwanensis TaxID=1347902 RepID=A0A917AJQ5_9BACI|nr:ATP phosphoribosyltransferase regulatory subunit [Priestia taiwanensis]MBM7361697.1 ATP phosphoribosyltransferase regulatory subunit [Priestia taiwanensis]GGE56295.1 ATP phosphoribosyltransferase regulatory subunit [Priestia taiwanensis]